MITIICIGDSITEGIGSSDFAKFSYPAQMQKILGENFKVINCGRNGATLMPPASGSDDQYRFQPQFKLALDSAKVDDFSSHPCRPFWVCPNCKTIRKKLRKRTMPIAT